VTTEIKPGDLIELSCPAGSTPQVAVGSTLPLEVADKDRSLVVVAVNGNKATLGPLKAGEFHVALPCTNSQTSELDYKITALDPQHLPDKAPPLGPVALAYPLWLWIALGIIFMAIAMSAFVIWRRLRKKFAPPPSARNEPTIAADEIFYNFLRQAESNKLTEKSDPVSTQNLFGKGNESLRAYLEYKLGFRASWATTVEFLGTLKVVLMRSGSLKNLAQPVETLLHQADVVRFSNDNPSVETRRNFLKGLKDVYVSVQKASAASQNIGQGSEQPSRPKS
jgi:hypothetical protein